MLCEEDFFLLRNGQITLYCNKCDYKKFGMSGK